MDPDRLDHVVLGAGPTGLLAALRCRRSDPTATQLVVDAAPRAGGRVQTLRSNGFVCELGPFAFARAEIDELLAVLDRAPRPVEPLPSGRAGWRFDGAGLAPVDVAPLPVSFATGNEELVQASRRELGPALCLGRAATAIRPVPGGFAVELGGEAPRRVEAARLLLALPLEVAADLLAPFDRALPRAAARLAPEPRAFVFLGGLASDAPGVRGYGIVPAGTVASPVAEMIFCTEVFAARALPGRCLVRVELAAEGDDAALAELAAAELDRWTGRSAALPFRKVHRFAGETDPGAAVECRARLAAIAARLPGLALG